MNFKEVNDEETIGLKGIIVKYLLYWKLFVIAFIITLIPAILYIVLYPKTYEMMARIQVQEDKEMSGGSFGLGEASGLMKSIGLGGITSGSINIDDEISLLTSNALLKEMVIHLGINVEYVKPFSFYKLYEDSPYVLYTDSVTNNRLTEDILFKVRVKSGTINIKTESNAYGKKSFDFKSLPATISLPNGNFTLALSPANTTGNMEDMNITFRPAGWVAEDLAEEFLIEELSKTSNVIELSCSDYEKQRGVNMLNSLIDFYNQKSNDYKRKEATKTLAFLDARIDSVTSSLRFIEYDIADYKNKNRLTDIQFDVQFYVEQMRDIQLKLIELESQSHIIKAMDDFIKKPENKYSLVPVLLSQDGEKGSPIMAYNEILMERARVIQNSNMDNPLVGNLTERADQLRESVYLSISNAQNSIQLAIDDVKGKEKQLFSKMNSFPDQERDFIDLKRQQEIFQGVYLILLQKREETALNSGLDRVKAKVIDSAFVKSKPIAPRKLYAAIGMLVFTLIVPVIFIFCREQYGVLKKEYRKAKG